MSTNHYHFARVFIRLAVFLAALVVISGAGFAVNSLMLMWSKLDAIRYEPDLTLSQKASWLEKSYIGTQRRILRTLDLQEFPPSVPVIDLGKQLAAAERNYDTTYPRAYLEIAQQSSKSLRAIKEFHVSEFTTAIEALRKPLLDQAAMLRQQYATQTTPPQPTNTQPDPTSGSGIAESQDAFRIYADSAENDATRLSVIKRATESLEQIRTQSKKQESLDQIRKASIFLTRAQSLLDFLQRREKESGNQQVSSRNLDTSNPDHEELVPRAERVAAELQRLKDLINDTLYLHWIADEDAELLATAAKTDLERAASIKAEATSVRLSTMREIALFVIPSLALAFVIMVFADLLRAFLNLSNNSDVLLLNTTNRRE